MRYSSRCNLHYVCLLLEVRVGLGASLISLSTEKRKIIPRKFCISMGFYFKQLVHCRDVHPFRDTPIIISLGLETHVAILSIQDAPPIPNHPPHYPLFHLSCYLPHPLAFLQFLLLHPPLPASSSSPRSSPSFFVVLRIDNHINTRSDTILGESPKSQQRRAQVSC